MNNYLIRVGWRETQRWYREGRWTPDTTASILARHAAARPEQLAVADKTGRYTWADLAGAAGRLAEHLARAGVDRGDGAVVHLADSAGFIAASIAVHAVEGIAIPMTASTGRLEIGTIVKRTGARGYIGHERLDVDGLVVSLGADDLQDLFEPGAPAFPPEGYAEDPDTLSEIMFTSGTTGRPKGVMNSVNTKLAGLRGFLSGIDARSDDVWGVVAPMAHNAGWLYSFLPALLTGAASVVVPRGRPEQMLDVLSREQVTTTFLVPAHLVDLVETWRKAPERWPLALRYVLTGAASVDPELVRAVAEEWSAAPVSMYGMTECQANLFTRPGDPLEVAATTVGRPCPGSEVALRAVGREGWADEGEVGEVVTRGATTFLGYFDDQAATSASFTKDGWFRSGDLGTREGDVFSIVGRIKEVISRGGVDILPADVEFAVGSHPAVGEVAVVGVPDERLGERVCACVMGIAPAPEELKEHFERQGYGRHVWPDEVLVFDDFPRTALGKVQRRQLADLAADRLQRT